jgi:hypothetical protein
LWQYSFSKGIFICLIQSLSIKRFRSLEILFI